MAKQHTVSPIDGSLYVERTLAKRAEIDRALETEIGRAHV